MKRESNRHKGEMTSAYLNKYIYIYNILYNIYIYRERERENLFSVAGHKIANSVAGPNLRLAQCPWHPAHTDFRLGSTIAGACPPPHRPQSTRRAIIVPKLRSFFPRTNHGNPIQICFSLCRRRPCWKHHRSSGGRFPSVLFPTYLPGESWYSNNDPGGGRSLSRQ